MLVGIPIMIGRWYAAVKYAARMVSPVAGVAVSQGLVDIRGVPDISAGRWAASAYVVVATPTRMAPANAVIAKVRRRFMRNLPGSLDRLTTIAGMLAHGFASGKIRTIAGGKACLLPGLLDS
ncbi:hypothetical protein AB0O07_34605 [Streptomyces sp. NPDC093085]|uniref:hypothetical protein n=1 Tax=Streptomyces sp. NPDC093085 TaxID=3155068 RepID=UPI0034283E61